MSGLEKAMEEVKEKATKPRRLKSVPPPVQEPTVSTTEPDAPVEAPPELAGLLSIKPRKEKKVKKTKRKPSGMAASLVAQAKPKTRKVNKKKVKATPAQLRAAKSRQPRVDWTKEIARFRAAKHNNMRMKMGSAGSAQVTRVRLNDWEGFKGLVAFTRGVDLFISKLPLAAAREAARKVK